MKSFERDHERSTNICTRCHTIGHYAFEHATGTMEPFGTDKVLYTSLVDRQPQPSDGPDYPEEFRAWLRRQHAKG